MRNSYESTYATKGWTHWFVSVAFLRTHDRIGRHNIITHTHTRCWRFSLCYVYTVYRFPAYLCAMPLIDLMFFSFLSFIYSQEAKWFSNKFWILMRSRHWHNLWEFNSFKLIFHAIMRSAGIIWIQKTFEWIPLILNMNQISINQNSSIFCLRATQLSDKNSWILIGNGHGSGTQCCSGAPTHVRGCRLDLFSWVIN